jgi:hypothetical protein
MMGPRVRAGVVLLFVFALGVLIGTAFERHRSAPPLATMSAAEEHEAAMVELREVVGLDDEQVAQVHAILAERQQIVQQTWEQFRPEVQAAMRQVHIEIAKLLRPDQRERFHDWLTRRREQSQGRHQLIPRER